MEFAEWETGSITHEQDKMKIYTDVVIDAPADTVWRVLTDWEKLREWSNLLLALEGDFRKDGKIKATFQVQVGGHVTEQVVDHTLVYFEDGRKFGWSDRYMLGAMHDNHIHEVIPINAQQSRFVQTDELSGVVEHFMGRHLAQALMEAYVKFNRVLKQRVETVS
jgi:uncharacterized protein YndB with AHSA1/START domain